MDLEQTRKDARSIFQAGLRAVEAAPAVIRHVHRRDNILLVGGREYDLTRFANIYVIGAGKAAAAMARPMEDLLEDRLDSGLVNVKYGHAVELRHIDVVEAGHPVPDEAGRMGAERMIHLLNETGEEDLIFFLVSGGGSALLPAPAAGLTLEDKKMTTRILLECGATIHETNTIRKHISALKGGQLARLAHPSTLISLILSDVVGDTLDTIASGPAVADGTTFADCSRIIEKFNLSDKLPAPVLDHLREGLRGVVPETPKSGDPIFTKTLNVIVGNNVQAVDAARAKAEQLGYNTLVLSTVVEGETREVAGMHASLAKDVLSGGRPVPRPACLISGGETTVTLRGKGLGGRNQEFALAAAIAIRGLEEIVVLSAGTDGTDGPTDASGAIADGKTLQRAQSLGLDAEKHLQENDSYHFFHPLGDLLVTGPTFTNVMDLHLVLVR